MVDERCWSGRSSGPGCRLVEVVPLGKRGRRSMALQNRRRTREPDQRRTVPTQSTGAALDGAPAVAGHRRGDHQRGRLPRQRRPCAVRPRHDRFSSHDRVGGDELEGTTIRELRFGAGKVWAANSQGVWSHSTTHQSGHWTLEYTPIRTVCRATPRRTTPRRRTRTSPTMSPSTPGTRRRCCSRSAGAAVTSTTVHAKKGGTWQKVATGPGRSALGPGPDRPGHLRDLGGRLARTRSTGRRGSRRTTRKRPPTGPR